MHKHECVTLLFTEITTVQGIDCSAFPGVATALFYINIFQPQEAYNAHGRKKEEWKMFKEALRVHNDKKMSAVRAFETQKSKPKGILQHLDVSRSQHD